MFINTYRNANDFVLSTRPTLEKNEVANSLILGIALRLVNDPEIIRAAPYLATVEDEHGLLAAACMTPPYNIVLYSNNANDDEPFALLIQNLLDNNWFVPGAVGPEQVAENFAKNWALCAGQGYKEGMRQRIFELSKVIPPRHVAGALRVATENDLELITRWTLAFNREALHKDDSVDAQQEAERRIRNQSIYVWELPDGRAVTMAAKTRPVSNVISISLVYTPPEYRGMGYASNCVAALSQRLLDEGWKFCSLVTDLANPISNSIYQKMGYRPVCDLNEYIFVIT
jgi:predicted GNAT family acetyltransferase